MVKVKNKKRSGADKISSKKETARKKVLNPFEVHINNEKIKVLGRKLKNDRGLPGVARAKALAKRKHTLLPEYKMLNKSNTFHDKRIGERDSGLSAEDKSMARYTAMRVKQHNKKNIFNLADDEVLTHKGQTLSEIEKFDDPKSEDEDEEDSGKLDSKFVRDVHFGGGMLKKADGAKSHKDLIEQLIIESKKRKAEMQKQKEATVELTEKLDSEWKDLLPLVNKNKKSSEVDTKAEVDDYDKVMRELKFEARGTPSDKLKTEDEIAREDKEKLEKLERERLERMRGVFDKPKTSKHRSADDLDDNFAYDDEEIEDVTLSYNQEGKSNVLLNIKINNKDEDAIDGESNVFDPDGDNADDDNEDDDEEDDSEAETDDDLSDLKASDSESEDELEQIKEKQKILVEEEEEVKEDDELERSQEEEEEDDDEQERAEEEFEDNALEQEDDLEQSEEDQEDDNEPKPTSIQLTKMVKLIDSEETPIISATKVKGGILKNTNKEPIEDKPVTPKTTEEIKEDLIRRKEIMEVARNELPYTFKLPENYDKLYGKLHGKSPEHHAVIIERMIKCNHPSLKEGNKDALGMLFVYLLQYINDLCTEIDSEVELKNMFQIFFNLTPFLYDLADLNLENAATSLVEVIKEKQGEFRGKKSYPGVEVLVYLKLVGCIFSTSDFQHHVVTPCVMFMEQMLFRSRVKTKRDIAYGLFLLCIHLEYTKLSKRFLPVTICFLNGIIHMAIPKSTVKILKVLPPFKSQSSLLVMTDHSTLNVQSPKMNVIDLLKTDENSEITEDFKHNTLHVAVSLLKDFYTQLLDLPSCYEIFEQSYKYLQQIPLTYYNDILSNEIRNFITTIEEYKGNRKLEFLQLDKVKPKALRLYDPSIEKVYDAKKHKVQSKEKAERDKLIYKLKKEKKGAMREIRRDKAYLGRVKLDRKLQSDAERRDKVKRIFSEAAMQQSELNAMDRGNKRKKK